MFWQGTSIFSSQNTILGWKSPESDRLGSAGPAHPTLPGRSRGLALSSWRPLAALPWKPIYGKRQLCSYLFCKHLHDRRYVWQSWPAAESLKHMSIFSILSLTLLNKSDLARQIIQGKRTFWKEKWNWKTDFIDTFRNKSERGEDRRPGTPKEPCVPPGPSLKAGQPGWFSHSGAAGLASSSSPHHFCSLLVGWTHAGHQLVGWGDQLVLFSFCFKISVLCQEFLFNL